MSTAYLSTEALAQRWDRRTEWITQQARNGAIPGAMKLGHLWRFDLGEIEAYETSKQSESIFALTPGSRARRAA